MKGLLLKDYYLLVKNGKLMLLVILGSIIIAAFFQKVTFLVCYPSVLAGILSMLLIQLDAKDKWELYSHTLPYTKGQLVSVKYLVGLIASAIVFILSALAQFISWHVQDIYHSASFLQLLFFLFIMSLIGPAIFLPLVFKWGAEKGRLIYYLVIGALMGISTQLSFEENNNTSVVITIVIALIIIVLYILSWRLSINLYKKREL